MKIDETKLYNLLMDNEVEGFKLIEDEILSSDPEDGGAEYTYVIKELSTNKFYRGSYTDWDLFHNTTTDHDGNVTETDLDCDLVEVFPEEVMRTIYISK